MPFTLQLPSRRVLGTLAAAALVLGFADLARGGISIAPSLLVVGYCVLVPAAIWRRTTTALSQRRSPSTPSTAPYRTAALVSLGVLLLYFATLAPSSAMWDTSEYITAAYTLGLPHPPGNPFFVLLGRVFSMLPIASSVAVRVNVLAALSSAIAAGMWFLITERILRSWVAEQWMRTLGGVLAAVVGATAFTVWNQSVVNEKVYTVSLAGLAIVSWLAIRWSYEADDPQSDRLLLMIAYLCGLGYANHTAGLLPMPAVGLAVLVHRPRLLLNARLLMAGAGLMLLGVTPFATQPIRSAHNPAINEGEPTACRDGLKFSCTFSKGTADAFAYNINREQYGKPDLTVRQAPITAQVGMWWLYFKWQWMRDARQEHQQLQSALAVIFLLLGVGGGLVHYARDRRSFWYFGPFVFTVTLLLIYYLNFRYGASQAPHLGESVAREVRDRDYFFLWSFSSWGVWVALGLIVGWERVARGLGRWFRGRGELRALSPRPLALLLAAPILTIGLVPLASNWSAASRRGEMATAAFAHDLLNSVEPYGVLVTYGDNDTFPLWYAQEVEGVRKDVTVAVLSLLNTDWFIRGIIRRPIYTYDAGRGPAVYRDRVWPKPSGSPVTMTLAQADSIPEYVVLREPARLQKEGLVATIDPQRLLQDGAGGGLLQRSDIVVLRMIADTWPARPVYLSRTTGDYGQRLGLGDNLLSQGLARKLFIPPTRATRDTVYVTGSGWFDMSRSATLWTDVFRGPAAIVQRDGWVDRPSVSIPFSYLLAGSELAEVLRVRGDVARSVRVSDTVTRVARAVGVGPSGEEMVR